MSNTASWFIAIKKILLLYDLTLPEELLHSPVKKSAWKTQVNIAVNQHWKRKIVYSSNLSNKLQYLNKVFSPGKLHPVLSAPVKSMYAVCWLPVKLLLPTGT